MTVAFIGHRKIAKTEALKTRLFKTIENLIVNEDVDTFLFGSKSQFDGLCYDIVTALKEKFSFIRRVYVRAEYEYIDREYTEYLLSLYENTFFPVEVHGAGAKSYIKRNRVMVDMCDVLVAFCDMGYRPSTNTNSGTQLAVDYADKKRRRIINLFE